MMRHEFGGHAVTSEEVTTGTKSQRREPPSSPTKQITTNPMRMETRVFPDLDALSRAALDEMLRCCGDAIRSEADLRSRSPVVARPRSCTRSGPRARTPGYARRGTTCIFLGRRAIRSAR